MPCLSVQCTGTHIAAPVPNLRSAWYVKVHKSNFFVDVVEMVGLSGFVRYSIMGAQVPEVRRMFVIVTVAG